MLFTVVILIVFMLELIKINYRSKIHNHSFIKNSITDNIYFFKAWLLGVLVLRSLIHIYLYVYVYIIYVYIIYTYKYMSIKNPRSKTPNNHAFILVSYIVFTIFFFANFKYLYKHKNKLNKMFIYVLCPLVIILCFSNTERSFSTLLSSDFSQFLISGLPFT